MTTADEGGISTVQGVNSFRLWLQMESWPFLQHACSMASACRLLTASDGEHDQPR